MFHVMQTIGQQLKQVREEKRLTLEQVFESTRIRVAYLRALEADDHSVVPSPVQARGYLRNYAEFLGMNLDQLLEDMRAQTQSAPSGEMITPMDAAPSPAAQPPVRSLSEDEASAQETTPQTSPKPARRKKADSQPEASPAASESDTSPKRRGRKKIEPESASKQQPEPIQEPVVEAEPDSSESIEPPQAQEPTQQEVNETLWQTWLNRLSSIISVTQSKETPLEEKVATETAPSESQASVEGQPESESDTAPQPSSAEIFVEIGAELRKRREMLSLHLDEVERNTHVKAHYLSALEDGAMDNLPSTVQTRGMLSNYASFLDLDIDSILLRYADALQARYRERNPQKPARKPGDPIVSRIPPIRSFIAGDIIFGFGIAILLIGFTVWGVSRVMTILSEEDIEPTAPSISDVLLATTDPSLFTPTATLAPVEDGLLAPTVTIVIPTQNLNVSVQVNLIAVERTYMRVIVDGEEVFNGRVVTGNAYLFEAETQIEVLVGSGAAIRVVYNGRDLGLMGDFGQVVNNIYLEEEVVTPTPLPSLTPTITHTPTATVPATSTPVPSNTPRTTSTP
ncbi:MAG TPA: RodZ domain-containing protein [Anaerolineales bacterium]|nr:RodZ domain-containing protein [Anaerolineales bacterium]